MIGVVELFNSLWEGGQRRQLAAWPDFMARLLELVLCGGLKARHCHVLGPGRDLADQLLNPSASIVIAAPQGLDAASDVTAVSVVDQSVIDGAEPSEDAWDRRIDGQFMANAVQLHHGTGVRLVLATASPNRAVFAVCH